MNKKKIIFFINSLKFFISHRINIAEIAYANNYEIIIVAKKDIKNLPASIENYKFISLNLRNSNMNIFNEIRNINYIKDIIKTHNPDICHFITIKSIFYASVLYKYLKKINVVISFSGIGSISSNKNIISVISKRIFLKILNNLKNVKNIKIIFQNLDDKNFIKKYYNFPDKDFYLIPGSGIDLKKFSFKKLVKKEKINFLFASRLLLDKGMNEFIKASQKIIDENFNVTFTIIGEIDKLNPSKINFLTVKKWTNNTNKIYYPFQTDIRKHIEYSDVVVLPSYREGYPKILIEASATGRAILTTNVPGCKECVDENVNGILVNARDYFSLYEGMKKIIYNQNELTKMSFNSRRIAEKKYDIYYVNEKHLLIYNSF